VLQDWLPKLIGATGNFEIVVFGLLTIIVLHRARDGVWPILMRLIPQRGACAQLDPAEPLPTSATCRKREATCCR
jgi:hypothetical protein